MGKPRWPRNHVDKDSYVSQLRICRPNSIRKAETDILRTTAHQSGESRVISAMWPISHVDSRPRMYCSMIWDLWSCLKRGQEGNCSPRGRTDRQQCRPVLLNLGGAGIRCLGGMRCRCLLRPAKSRHAQRAGDKRSALFRGNLT